MSTLSDKEQALFDVARAALPNWYFSDPAKVELVAAFAKQFAQARDQVDFTYDQGLILKAVIEFLRDHAKDKGTRQQAAESPDQLRVRLRAVEDAVTLPALTSGVNAVLAAAGNGPCAILELRKDKAFLRTLKTVLTVVPAAQIADGEYFVIDDNGSLKKFEFDKNGSVSGGAFAIDISTAVTASNVVSAIAGTVDGNGNLASSGSFGIPADPAKVDIWSLLAQRAAILRTLSVANPGFTALPGGHACFLSRGRRLGAPQPRNAIIIILPYGTTSDTAAAVAEQARQKKGAGTIVYVETRRIP